MDRGSATRSDVLPPGEQHGVDPSLEAMMRLTERATIPAPELIAGATPRDPLPLEPGDVIKQYEIIRELGHGGMGRVFLARDTRLARLCAIKLLLAYSGEGAGRFLAEARATARCKHESIVIIYEVDELRGYPYMVLEYLEGRTLRAWMTERELSEPLSPCVAAELLIPVAQALVCAHDAGLVHRDLKPENIFLTDGGQVKVLDFGVAKRVTPGEIGSPAALARDLSIDDFGWTRDGALVGTRPYMSPEQWLGADIDFQSDIWAVGIILYELLAGVTPMAPVSMAELAEIPRLDVPMPSAAERLPGAGALGAVIDRCLKKRKSERIGSARELLGELTALLDAPSPPPSATEAAPFAGLSALQEPDAARFFGRDRDIAAVLGRLRNQQLVVVAGPSGAGKSSFVRAGLIPALKRSGAKWEVFVMRPGRRPLAALADVLAQVPDARDAERPSSPDAAGDDADAILRSRPGSLGARLRGRCRRAGSDHRVLLFVDQFEEVYTLGADPGERAAFLACLEGVADDPSSPLRVVLAVRSDFLDRVVDNRQFTAEVTRGLVLLPPIGEDGLREALIRPVLAAGYDFESDALVEQILGALRRAKSPLPLLQFTGTKLWEARDRSRKLLSEDSYRALGGVEGALSTHADAVLASLSANEQRIARALFLRLVTPERTRALVSLSELRELAEDGASDEVARRLADARLLHIESDGEGGGGVVEIVHESLIEGWAKLRRWLDESEEDAQFLARLRAAAHQWEASGEPEGLLWRDRAAKDAGAWLERRRSDEGADGRAGLGKREARYLSAVTALFERTRTRRRRQIIGLIGTLAALASVVSYLAVRADREAARAQAEARQARNATRMAAAREFSADPTTALALLREVEPPEAPRGWHELARWALQEGPASVVLTHADQLHSAAFSPDGERVVIASGGNIALVQRADGTGEPLVLRGHENRVFTAVFSPDGKRIVTASWDATARVWSADGTGEPLILRGHERPLYSAAFSPDGRRIVTASADKTARVWGADGSGEPLVLRGHGNNVVWAAWSPDGERIVTVAWDGMARVWRADGAGEPVLLDHKEGVNMAEISPDGRRIVTASHGGKVRVWSADGAGEPLLLRGHQGEVEAAAWSPDGKRIVTSADDKTARVWSADGVGEPLVLRGHQGGIGGAFFSPDGKRIVTASMDKTVRIWSVGGAGRPLIFRGHQDVVSSVAFSPDGRSLVTASRDRRARVWSADGAGEPLVILGHQSQLFMAAYSPDGKRIVTAAGTAQVWNADGTGEPLVLAHPLGGVTAAAFSPDGKRIVTASVDKTARVWSADGAGELVVLRGHTEHVNSGLFSPDGNRIVTSSLDGTARVWSADSGAELHVLRGHDGNVLLAAFSPDGERIITAGDKTARVWSTSGAGEPLILRGHEAVTSAAWSPDGERIATTGDKTVRIWSADDGRELLALRGGDGGFVRVAWSPDGERIAAASPDSTIWVWTDLEPLRGLDDPRLWTATTYCMSVERRVDLLGVPEATAKADQEACESRVLQARAASFGAR